MAAVRARNWRHAQLCRPGPRTDRASGRDWIAAVSQTCQQQALRDLDRAYASFFAGRAHYPTPRRKGVNDSFRFQGREVETKRLNAKWSAVRLPKVGLVKFRDTRPMHGTLKNATVTLDALGWHISFVREIAHIVPVNICPSVGIDRGVANTLALSANVDYALDIPTGERMSVPRSLEAIERRHRAAQHIVARRKRGSVRRAKALRRAPRSSRPVDRASAAIGRTRPRSILPAALGRLFWKICASKT